MTSPYEDRVYAALGFGGGLLLAFAQVPQIYRVQTRKSSSDISYVYQFTFATGIIMFLFYYGYNRRYPLLIPASISLAMILYLIALKTYIEVITPWLKAARDNVHHDGQLQQALLEGASNSSDVGAEEEGPGNRSSDDEFLSFKAQTDP